MLFFSEIKDVLTQQDPLMLTLGLLSAVSLAVVIDRLLFWLVMALRARPISPEVYRKGLRCTRSQLGPRANPSGHHYLQAMVRVWGEPGMAQEQIAQTISEQVDQMNARLGLLDLIARISPMIGILGTVVGMSASFGGVEAMTTASPAAISGGISVALKTTACGLVISIGATVSSAGFRRLTERALLKIGRVYCGIRQVENAHHELHALREPEPNGDGRSDADARHDIPDHSPAPCHLDA